MAAAAASGSVRVSNTRCIRIPENFFAYIGPGKAGNSLYRCLKSPTAFNTKSLFCFYSSRQNLKKQVEVENGAMPIKLHCRKKRKGCIFQHD